jgi:glc operon protein GlcG
MYNKKVLSLGDVKRVVAAAEAEAEQNGWNVVLAVVDDGGHLMYLQRDRVQLGSIEVAITKARAALLFRRPTRVWEETVASGRYGYLAIPGMLPIEGGVPLVYENEIVGAIGVSGVKSPEDGQIAEAGARAFSSHFSGPITPPSGR